MSHRFWSTVLFAVVLSPALSAQTLGGIVGEVKDATGAVVVGATVSVTNTDTNATRSTLSNEAGLYSFPGLVPGPYTVRLQMTEFRPVARSLELEVQQTARIDFSLELGQGCHSEVRGQRLQAPRGRDHRRRNHRRGADPFACQKPHDKIP